MVSNCIKATLWLLYVLMFKVFLDLFYACAMYTQVNCKIYEIWLILSCLFLPFRDVKDVCKMQIGMLLMKRIVTDFFTLNGKYESFKIPNSSVNFKQNWIVLISWWFVHFLSLEEKYKGWDSTDSIFTVLRQSLALENFLLVAHERKKFLICFLFIHQVNTHFSIIQRKP